MALDARPPLTPVSRVTFAEIPSAPVAVTDAALAALLSPRSASFEACRLLRARLKAPPGQRALQCLGIVSATHKEGTTTVALGLAHALAQEEQRVLVVEATLREPAIARMLGLPAAPGLNDWLDSGVDTRVPVRRLEPWGLFLLAGGTPVLTADERLGSPAMATVLAAARSAFDVVIVDCPALESSADSVVIQDLLEGLLLVVRARHAQRNAIRAAAATFKPERVRGVVFTDHATVWPRFLRRRRKR